MAYYGYEVETNLNNSAFTLDKFTSNGLTAIYTLSVPKPLTSRAILVTFDGVVKQSEVDYTLDQNSDLRLLTVPSNGVIISALHLTRPTHLYTIPDRSITSTKLSGSLQTPANLDVSGDLNVTGTLTVNNQQIGGGETTVLSTLSIRSAYLTINSDTTGSPTETSGIKIERGTSPDKTFSWDEINDKWTVGTDTIVAGTVEANLTGTASNNVLKTGDTLTGPLILAGNPSTDNQASNKAYVDRQAFLQAILF